MEVVKLIELIGDFTKEDVKFLKAAKVGLTVSEAGDAQLEKFSKHGVIQVSQVSHPSATDLPISIVSLTDDGERLINSILQESDESEVYAGKEAPKPFVDAKFRDELQKTQTEKLAKVTEAANPLAGRLKEIADLDKQAEAKDTPKPRERLTEAEQEKAGMRDVGAKTSSDADKKTTTK